MDYERAGGSSHCCVLCSKTILMNEKDTYNELTQKGLEACNTVRILHYQPAIKFDKSTPVFVYKS